MAYPSPVHNGMIPASQRTILSRDAQVLEHVRPQPSLQARAQIPSPVSWPSSYSASQPATPSPSVRTGVHVGMKRTGDVLDDSDSEVASRTRKRAWNSRRVTFAQFKKDALFHASLHRIYSRAQCHFATKDPFPLLTKRKRDVQRQRKLDVIAPLWNEEASSAMQNPRGEQLTDELVTLVRPHDYTEYVLFG